MSTELIPVIVGVGAQTALGLSAAATSAAVRAGISASVASGRFRSCLNGDPLILSQLATLSPQATLAERMHSMAVAAAEEALSAWREAFTGGAAPPELGVLLSLPAARSGFSDADIALLAGQIVQELRVPIDSERCALVTAGHAAGLSLVEEAASAIRSGEREAFLVGGVESYLGIAALNYFERQQRLKSDQQPNGFIPGEGAGFLLLCSRSLAARIRLPVLAEVLGAAQAEEPRCWWEKLPTLGQGLTLAFQSALERSAGVAAVHATYSDLNGESWRADEWGYAYVRTGERHASPLDHRHPASYWGDVGAASGPLLASMAALDLKRFFAPNSVVLVWAASDLQRLRAACLLGKPKE